MENNKYIFCLLGKSSSGKDTIKNLLLKLFDKFSPCIPITTRPMRKDEENGKDYIFTDKDTFIKMINNNELLEHRKYTVKTEDGEDVWYYGNIKPTEKYSLMIGTLDVYESIKDIDDYIVVPIYIELPDEIRLYRSIQRELKNDNPNFKELSRRFVADQKDFDQERLNKLGINNLDLNKPKIFMNDEKHRTANYIMEYLKREYIRL